MSRPCRLWLGIATFLGLCLSTAAQDKPSTSIQDTQASQEAALRALVDQYFAAYAKKDLNGMITLWSPNSPHLDALKKEAAEFFGPVEDVKVSHLRIDRLKVVDQEAHLRVVFELSTVDSKTRQPAPDRGSTMRAMDCVREASLWKVWQDTDPIQDLAERLIAAKSEAELEEFFERDRDLVTSKLVLALIHRGEKQRSQGDLAGALNTFHVAQRAGEKAADEPGISAALLNIGITQDMGGESNKSLETLGESLKIAQAHDDKRLIAKGLVNRGDAYMHLGQPSQALRDFNASLEIVKLLQEKQLIAQVLHNIGEVNVLMGNHGEAINYFHEALAVLEADKSDALGIARELRGIGVVYLRQGDNGAALQFFQRSLAALGPGGDKGLSRHLFNDIGQVYEAQGDFEQALSYYRKSLALSKEIGDERGLAASLENIGIAEEEQGAYSAAGKDFHESLDIFEKTDTKGGVLALLSNLGEVEYAQGNFEKALEYQEKSQVLAESLGDQENLAEGAAYIALICNKQHKFDKALVQAKRAIQIAERISSKDVLWQAHDFAGVAYQALGQTEQARQNFLEAISIVELLRTEVAGGEEQQQSYLSSRIEPYYGMIELLDSQKQPSEALAYAELAKGRVLLDVLQNGRAQVTKAMTASERERETQLQAEMISLNKQVEQENAEEKPDPRRFEDLKRQVEAARLHYADFQTNLFTSHPELKIQRGQVNPVSLQDAAKLLPDSKSAFLEFAIGEEKSHLFVLSNNGGADQAVPELKVFAIPVTDKQLRQMVEHFQKQLSRRDLAFQPSSRDLFRMLIAPAKAQLEGKNALVIVPDGPLWNLPFQALLGENNRYLLEDYAISYAPSLTVLREMIRVHQKSLARVAMSESSTLLAMADPKLTKEALGRAAVASRSEALGPLPEAKQEAGMLKELYGSEQSKVYMGADAREDRFKVEAGNFRILHLATHGIFNNASPMYSSVLLSSDEGGQDDGLLEAWEIMQMDLKADLAVLSACETGRGRVSRGEGMIGLTWAFFVAGVPTTVVSQWKVESASTAKLMVAFHRALKAKDARANTAFATARALQRAELQLLHGPQYVHPFYWAGFVVVGNPQ